MSNFNSVIQTNVKDDVHNGGARFHSPTIVRSVLQTSQPNGQPLPSASAAITEYKNTYHSPYSAKSGTSTL